NILVEMVLNVPSLFVEFFPRFERQDQLVPAIISYRNLDKTRWTNVDADFQVLILRSCQRVSPA
ncbi:hypothetical protein X777_06957, partial [Ooceraea biroi]